jgi:RimJ/RimL family protein N-acetyltransferase
VNQLIFGCDREVASWVAERIPHVSGSFEPCSAIGVAGNGKLLAGIVYHEYQPDHGTIQLSMAAENPMWARKETIAALLSYPFRQIGVFKIWTATPHDNEAALKVNQHIGFKREAILAHHFGRKRHGVICRMLQPDFIRLYENAHGKI